MDFSNLQLGSGWGDWMSSRIPRTWSFSFVLALSGVQGHQSGSSQAGVRVGVPLSVQPSQDPREYASGCSLGWALGLLHSSSVFMTTGLRNLETCLTVT